MRTARIHLRSLIVVIGLSLCACAGAQTITWTNIGPGGGGWITCLTAHPTDSDIVYAGCDVGGVYRSTDAGLHWVRCTEGLTADYTKHIVIDPTSPDVVYAGGCGGVFRSAHAGATWTWLRNGFPEPTDHRYSASVGALVMRPDDHLTLYAGIGYPRGNSLGNGMIYRTDDSGESWAPLDGIARLADDACFCDLAIRPDTPDVMLAATTRGLFRSEDAGATWARAGSGLPEARVSDIAISPTSPDRVYVTVRTPAGEAPWRGGVWRSDDGGGSWRKLNSGTELPLPFDLCFDPRDAQVMFAACRRHYGHAEGRMFAGGIYRSEDAGVTWEQVLDDRFAADVLVSPADSRIVYATLTAHPYHDHCKGGGVMRSADGGDTWRAENLGLTVTQVGTIVCDPQAPEVLYVGTGGHGAFRGVDHGVEEGAN